MLNIISYNLNGIRAALKKDLAKWIQENNADIYCFQEIKANAEDIDSAIFANIGYDTHWFSAEKKGYSGVGIISKNIKWESITLGNGYQQSDFEGRVIIAEHKNFYLINAYFPSGTSGDERQDYKYQWLDEFYQFIQQKLLAKKTLIITGDYNIAHTEIDIHDPKGNKNTSGFLPQEREWMTNFLNLGLCDSYRYKNPETKDGYTWWSQRFPSVRLQNKGWRIDYICISNNLQSQLQAAFILPQVKHSDHCPLGIELAI